MQIVSQRSFRLIYFQIKNNFPAKPRCRKAFGFYERKL